MSPPSIGNSGCGDVDEAVGDVKEDDTASDISEIESLPVPRVYSGGTLKRQQSGWNLFDCMPTESDHILEDAEAAQDEHLDYAEDIEVNKESKLVADKELDRMDEEIFGLLRPSAQPSRSADGVPGVEQVSIVYPGGDCERSQTDSLSRKRKVRLIIEPEVFLVPFSSREFDEPFFEDTDDLPAGVEIESRFKNLNLDPFSQECRGDPHESEEEDIPEEITSEVADLDEEGNGQVNEPHSGFKSVEGTQWPSDMNIADGNDLVIGRRKIESKVHLNENITYKADENREDTPMPEVQKEPPLRNVNFDPYSQGFVDDQEELFDNAEEESQRMEQEKVSSREATEVGLGAAPETSGVFRQDEEPYNLSKDLEETQTELNVAGDIELTIKERKTGNGPHRVSDDDSVKDEGLDDLPAHEVQNESAFENVDFDSPSHGFAEDGDNVEEDTQEELMSDNNNFDNEANTEPQFFLTTSSMEMNEAEAVAASPSSTELIITGTSPNHLGETETTHEDQGRKENTSKAVEATVLEQGKQDMDAILNSSPSHRTNTTEQLSMEVVSHNENEEVQPLGEEAKVAELFYQDAESGGPGNLVSERKGEDSLPDPNFVPVSMEYDNINAVTEQRNEGGDHTVLGNMLQTSTEAPHNTKADDSFEEDKEEEEEEEEDKSSEEERTETFEFNMSPPSIGNSGCGNLDEAMGDVKGDHTASDVSEIENLPVPCVYSRGTLKRQQSGWNLFDHMSTESDHKALEDDVLENVVINTEHDNTYCPTVMFGQTTAEMAKSNICMSTDRTVTVVDNIDNEIKKGTNKATPNEEDHMSDNVDNTILEGLEQPGKCTESIPVKDKMEMGVEYLDTLDNLHKEIKSLKECNEELKVELDEKEQEKYTIECLIKSVNIGNGKLLDQVEILENELQTVLSEKENIELELSRRREIETVTLGDTSAIDKLNAEIKALQKYNEELKLHLEESDRQRMNMDSIVQQVNIDNEELLSAMDKHNTEIKSLKKYNEELEIQLQESDKQKENMDCIVEQVNIENEELLERMYDLEKELKTELSRKRDTELENKGLKEILEESKRENETLHNRLKDIETENARSNEAEITGMAAELEQLKALHAKIGDIRREFSGEKEAVYETLEKTNSSQIRLSLLQEFRIITSSVVQMSDDFKGTVLEVLADSAQHKSALETDLAQIKEEYFKTLDQQNIEIKSLKERNEELKSQLEEGDSMENEKLLERIRSLENKLRIALDEKNDIEKELDKRRSKEEYIERELSNLKDNMRLKTFNWEEMGTALDQVWSDKQKLEEELGLVTTSLEESEAARLDLVKEVNRMRLKLEKVKDEHVSLNKTGDYAHLREKVELLEGSLLLSNHNEARMKKELEFANGRASSISSDDEFAQQKEQYKFRIEEQIGELEKENTMILQEFARPFEHDEKSESALRNLEKQMKTMQGELQQLRDESIITLRKENRGKRCYKKLKKRLFNSEEGIKSLKESFHRDIREIKETNKDFKHHIQNDMEQVKFLLKQATDNKRNRVNEKNRSPGDERVAKQMTEVKDLLEKTLLNVQRNHFESEMSRRSLRLESEKAQELENKYREVDKRLHETECDLAINKRKLKDKEGRFEELTQQLESEREDNKHMRKSYKEAEGHARQQVMEKEREVNNLHKLLTESEGNTANLREQVRMVSSELEATKSALAQRDSELSRAQPSLCEGEELLNSFRKSLVEIQHELEETKKQLIEKSEALDYTERYAEMLFTSARVKDREINETNKLVYNVVRDVERVEKLLQSKKQLEASTKSSQETTTEEELSGDQSDKQLELDSLQRQRKVSLDEKDKTIEQLRSSVIQLKRDLELTSSSLKEKDNELQQLISGFENQEGDMGISCRKNSRLEDENDSLRHELAQLNTSLSQQEDEIKELRGMLITRDSEVRVQNREAEKLKFLLHQKEQNIYPMKSEIAEKERENKSLTEHLQKKMAEIRRLQEALDNMKSERCNTLEAYPGIIAHMKASGKSAKDLEDLRNAFEHKVYDEKERKIADLESAVARLEQDVVGQNVLLEGKEEELSTANLGIQVKEEELGVVKARLRQLEKEFQVYKQNRSERESKLEKENNALKDKVKDLETRLCQKQKEIAELKRLIETKDTEGPRKGNPVDMNKREEEGSRSLVNEEKQPSYAEMVKSVVGEQIANVKADRIEQMLADMNAVQMELEDKRKENWMITKKNKALKERVAKLEKQSIENDKVHSERLNNVLNNVRMKKAEIWNLRALLAESHVGAGVSKVILH